MCLIHATESDREKVISNCEKTFAFAFAFALAICRVNQHGRTAAGANLATGRRACSLPGEISRAYP